MVTPERSEKCKEVFSLLSEYLDLELPNDACREIDDHIAGCAPCVDFTETLRKTVEMCRRYRPEAMPEPLGTEARRQLLGAYLKMRDARRR